MMGKLIARLFHARTIAHIHHLKTRSYASHIALAAYGLIDDYSVPYKYVEEPIPHLEDLVEWIQQHRDECCDAEDTHIQNIIDEIVALARSTVYKLRFLK
jgi:hypothetical protein